MTKRIRAKHKIDRRMKENIWGRPRSPVNIRPNPPGQHGATRRVRRLSDFGLQLRAKQKLKGYYGNITERQFRRIWAEADRMRGDTAQNLIGLLERRLDAIVYRACLVPTVFSARQLVSHGHIRVNDRRVTIPSYRVSVGDRVEVISTSRDHICVLAAISSQERGLPDYLDVDHDNRRASMVRVPMLEDTPYPVKMEPQQVVEFYSRN